MSSTVDAPKGSDWLEASGLPHILRTFKMAVHPGKIVLAIGGVFLTAIWGLSLDWVWTARGAGIEADAIARYVGQLGEASTAEGQEGIFSVFRDYQLGCIRDAIESVRYGRLLGPVKVGEPVSVSLDPTGAHPTRGAFANLVLMGRGAVWMIKEHFVFACLFLTVSILIWAFFGGAICRMAAVQYARDESITMKEALEFAWEKLFGCFFMAPIIPLLLCFAIGLALWVGGLVLRIPWFGDIVGGLLFFLALIGGFLTALVLIGTVGGGSLFWPTIAVEGSDSFDAISRSFSYVYGRPLRAMWYTFLALVYGSFCWLFVKFVVWLTLASTHLLVGFGSGEKLDSLWFSPSFEMLYRMSPDADHGLPRVTAYLIGLWILPIIGIVWAFLASFYFTGSTIIYYLLRRDVDGTDLGDIYVQEEQERPFEPQPEAAAPDAAPATTEMTEPAVETKTPAGDQEKPSAETRDPAPAAEPATRDEDEDQSAEKSEAPSTEEPDEKSPENEDKDG